MPTVSDPGFGLVAAAADQYSVVIGANDYAYGLFRFNAALLAAAVIALHNPAVAEALDAWRAAQTNAVADAPESET